MAGLRAAIADKQLDAFVETFYAGIGQPVPVLESIA